MSRNGRRSALVLAFVAVLITGLSMTALASEEGEPEEGAPVEEEETEEAPPDSGLTPAVDMSPEEAAPADVDWTYRYMIPTGLALAVIIVLLTSIKYFTDVVRKRYRIVDE